MWKKLLKKFFGRKTEASKKEEFPRPTQYEQLTFHFEFKK